MGNLPSLYFGGVGWPFIGDESFMFTVLVLVVLVFIAMLDWFVVGDVVVVDFALFVSIIVKINVFFIIHLEIQFTLFEDFSHCSLYT